MKTFSIKSSKSCPGENPGKWVQGQMKRQQQQREAGSLGTRADSQDYGIINIQVLSPVPGWRLSLDTNSQ